MNAGLPRARGFADESRKSRPRADESAHRSREPRTLRVPRGENPRRRDDRGVKQRLRTGDEKPHLHDRVVTVIPSVFSRGPPRGVS
jgi:hypothetical protein